LQKINGCKQHFFSLENHSESLVKSLSISEDAHMPVMLFLMVLFKKPQ